MQQIDMSREMHMDGRQSAASEVFGCIPHGARAFQDLLLGFRYGAKLHIVPHGNLEVQVIGLHRL